MPALRSFSKLLKDERRGHTNHYVNLVCQSETKRKQTPQSEANVSRHKCNLKKPRFLMAQENNAQNTQQN